MFKIIQYATMWNLLTRQRWAGPPSLRPPGRSHCTPVPHLATAPGTAHRGSAHPPPHFFSLSARRHDPGSAVNHHAPIPSSKLMQPPPPASTALVHGRDNPCVHDGATVTVIVALPRRGRETRDRAREAGSWRDTRLRKPQEGVADTRALRHHQ